MWQIKKLNCDDLTTVNEMSALASKIVKEHYDPIIGAEQNDYMIKMFQSPEAVAKQAQGENYFYYIENESSQKAGYMAFYQRGNEMYLNKLYVDKAYRGQGLSKIMMDFVIAETKKLGLSSITLNVNKNNPTIKIYEHIGFEKIRDEVNDIGRGYVMDDYVYELKV